ncbi:MAG: NapH/MauN family ferredoxin-type protein, partial [Epsilonproteobacteria bacterium]|nr:NapH/MauN family ferredoxin-type protein [Campylobacterota bacterium]
MNKYQDRNTIAKTTFGSTFYTVDDQGKKRLSLRAKRWAAII